jgi:hypothetical protein
MLVHKSASFLKAVSVNSISKNIGKSVFGYIHFFVFLELQSMDTTNVVLSLQLLHMFCHSDTQCLPPSIQSNLEFHGVR